MPKPVRAAEPSAAHTQHDPAESPAFHLPVNILPQPNDETCGPTCLHAVYRFWNDPVTLEKTIETTRSLDCYGAGRGTLAVLLGVDALRRGYSAILHTFNLQVFDPTWFDAAGHVEPAFLAERLGAQRSAKEADEPRFAVATDAYVEFLRLGGHVRFQDLTSTLLARFVRAGCPILTGLSATYLYRCAREYGPNDDYDDVRGSPAGHFVVIHGYDPRSRRVAIADPLANNPGFSAQLYQVPVARLVASIMLGVLTYDANLLVITPKDFKPWLKRGRNGPRA